MLFRHIGFQVKNLDKSIEFYQKLGFVVTYSRTEDWSEKKLGILKIVKMLCNDIRIELIENVDLPEQAIRSSHIALSILNSLNIDIPWFIPPEKSLYSDLVVGFLKDPDGYLIELVHANIQLEEDI